MKPLRFDTEDEEDGPGNLDDYIGYNASGDWIMHVYRFAGNIPLVWDNWAVEIIGQPVTGAAENALPLVTGLNDAYPNPFNSQTIVYFSIADEADVRFAIYDVAGRLVKDYELKTYIPGRYQLKWDSTNNSGESIASGIYFLKMTVGNDENAKIFTHKLTLLK